MATTAVRVLRGGTVFCVECLRWTGHAPWCAHPITEGGEQP